MTPTAVALSTPEAAQALARARATAPLFAALGDPTRLDLVLRLARDGPDSTTRLGARTRLSRQAIAKHLGVLAEAGLVQGHRFGRERLWELVPQGLLEAREQLERISSAWDGALGRLKAFVET